MAVSKLLLSGAVAALALLGSPQAKAAIIAGSASFTDTGPSGNGLNFTGTFSPSVFNFTIGALPVVLTNFLTIASTDSNNAFFGTSTATDNFTVSFNLTAPGGGSGSTAGTGTETTFSLFGAILGAGGSIVWNGPTTIAFGDGSNLSISLSDETFDGFSPNQTIGVDATFRYDPATLANAVPEPATLTLFGVGLLGLGMAARRRYNV